MSHVLSNRPGSGSGRAGIAGMRKPDPALLVLASNLAPEAVRRLLDPYGFTDIKRADVNIQAMAGEPRTRLLLAEIIGSLLAGIARTANPDQALDHWERFVQMGSNRAQLFAYLSHSPRMLSLLCSIFGNSPALAQTLIRDPMLVYWLAEEQVMSRRASRTALTRALQAVLANLRTTELKLEALRRFKRREMLRIGVRDLFRLAGVTETTTALSDLATVLIQAAYEIVRADLRRQYGMPMHRDRSGRLVETGFAVVAMGKLGGGELNFSSDVDLIYVYASDEGVTLPWPAGSVREKEIKSIPNEEYFEYLARDLTRALTQITQEGYVFRVDLRLRAEGATGRLARSLADYEQYYRTRGQDWERLALLKAWPVAGALQVGRQFLRRIKLFIFAMSDGRVGQSAALEGPPGVISQVKAIKEMIDDKMASRGQERRNVKLGIGGIREIEFIVQTLQVLIGGRILEICERNTVRALAKLRRYRILGPSAYRTLREAYLFLRDVEHKIQMVHELQTHSLPGELDEVRKCAVRLGYRTRGGQDAAAAFLAMYRQHTEGVHRLFRSLFYSRERSRLLRAALKKVEVKAKVEV